MGLIELTDDNFKEEIATGVTVVDFWAPWCGPCRMIAPSIEELAAEISDVKFAKLNVDNARETAMEFGVMSIPTLIFFKDGKEVERSVGVIPKSMIEQKAKAAKN